MGKNVKVLAIVVNRIAAGNPHGPNGVFDFCGGSWLTMEIAATSLLIEAHELRGLVLGGTAGQALVPLDKEGPRSVEVMGLKVACHEPESS